MFHCKRHISQLLFPLVFLTLLVFLRYHCAISLLKNFIINRIICIANFWTFLYNLFLTFLNFVLLTFDYPLRSFLFEDLSEYFEILFIIWLYKCKEEWTNQYRIKIILNLYQNFIKFNCGNKHNWLLRYHYGKKNKEKTLIKLMTHMNLLFFILICNHVYPMVVLVFSKELLFSTMLQLFLWDYRLNDYRILS